MIKRILGPFFEDKTRVRRNKDTRMELNEDYSRSFQDLLFYLLWSFFLPIRSNRIIQLKNTSQHDSLFVFTNPKKNDKNVKIQRKREGRLLFPSDQRFAYLHYPFPGTISITTSHSDSRALTQTRIATRGTAWKRIYPRTKKRVSLRLFLFPRIIHVWNSLFLFFIFFSPPSLFFPRVVVVDKRACTGDRSRIESISSPLQHPQSPLGHVVNPGWRWYVHRCANTIRARRRCIRCTNPRTTGFIDSQGVNSGAFISVRPIERPGWKETSTRPRIRVHYIN